MIARIAISTIFAVVFVGLGVAQTSSSREEARERAKKELGEMTECLKLGVTFRISPFSGEYEFGAEVFGVQIGCAAEKSGIRVGDFLLEFDGTRLQENPQVLNDLIKAAEEPKVPAKLWRDGEIISLQIDMRQVAPEDIYRSIDALRLQIDESRLLLNRQRDEIAQRGRDALRCDGASEVISEAFGDPSVGAPIDSGALQAIPLELMEIIDACAKFQHGYLNFVAGSARLAGFPLGYISEVEAFEYYVAAMENGYPKAAGFALALLVDREEVLEKANAEKLATLIDELERQGVGTAELIAAIRNKKELNSKVVQLRAQKEEVLRNAGKFCRELKQTIGQGLSSNDTASRGRARELITEAKELCQEAGIALP